MVKPCSVARSSAIHMSAPVRGGLPGPEEVEACAGDLRARAMSMPSTSSPFEVVARFEAFGGEVARGADFPTYVVFAADGYAVDDEVSMLLISSSYSVFASRLPLLR